MSEKDTVGKMLVSVRKSGWLLTGGRNRAQALRSLFLLWLRGKAYNTELLNTTAVSLSPSEKTTSHI